MEALMAMHRNEIKAWRARLANESPHFDRLVAMYQAPSSRMRAHFTPELIAVSGKLMIELTEHTLDEYVNVLRRSDLNPDLRAKMTHVVKTIYRLLAIIDKAVANGYIEDQPAKDAAPDCRFKNCG